MGSIALLLLVALPLAGFVVLGLAGKRLRPAAVAVIGAGSVGLAALDALGLLVRFLLEPPEARVIRQTLWVWLDTGELHPRLSLLLDPLALVMALVVTGVGFLIHLYSIGFMRGEEGNGRFFAQMNLFVASMLVLVLADDLFFLYLGWEGVGLSSYLLIGFWWRDEKNGRAARKAFIVTRIGDAAMAVGLFVLFQGLGTLQISEVAARATAAWRVGAGPAVLASALLFAGAAGKSAQLPLQTWLPDAMAGPTPVSALIHAATMVTAGVYLIARMHALFELAPDVLAAVAVVGAVTMLLAGLSAIAQRDIKRVLAYSTMSQIGMMFLALGVGAWSAAIFHLVVHAFFKALLFLSAGVVILALDHEHDLFRMGGLRKELPLAFWTFAIAGASLAGLPLVTAGFYSKDLILWEAWASSRGGPLLGAAGIFGALVTSLYVGRVILLAFFGERRTVASVRPGRVLAIPLVVLAGLSLVGGLVELPPTLGHAPSFSWFLEPSLPAATAAGRRSDMAILQGLTSLASLSGILLAYLGFLRHRRADEELPLVGPGVTGILASGFGFDALYDLCVVRPLTRIARANSADALDRIFEGLAALVGLTHRALCRTQTGRLRTYAAAMVVGTVVIVGIAVLR
ncbi:MAG: NADH-quinone oxidoreductase subunit L [Deltaproteobacteria bacterium]|nr:NADH-quinone oxidoreductase subunit L [Deltaproteobacteria bacterium]